MTKEELQARIEKKEKDIQKINKRIVKWSANMNDEAMRVARTYGYMAYGSPDKKAASTQYILYKNAHKNDNTVWNNDDWRNRGPNLDELMRAYIDLFDADNTINKYKTALDKLTNFEKEEKIEIIWNFLQDWKQKTFDWIVENCTHYYDLQQHEEEAWQAYIQQHDLQQQQQSYRTKKSFTNSYYRDIGPTTKEVYLYKGGCDTAKLEKILTQDVRDKYTSFVNQVTEKAGEIVDASDLKIGGKGDINGFVQGTKNKVKVWTTLAGGYIQCWHYRSYVHIVD